MTEDRRGTGGRTRLFCFLSSILCILAAGCASTKSSAPVVERASLAQKAPAKISKNGDWRPQTYTVQKGDTLYDIALEHGFEYKELAEWNGIAPPYTIRIGQQLKFNASPQPVVVTPLKAGPVEKTRQAGEVLKTQPKAAQPGLPAEEKKGIPVEDDDRADRVEWSWPTAGKVIASFNESSGSGKGLDIGGKSGQPVLAAGPGKVVYSGNGLRGYGKLVIIKHNKTYLSAYAHNRQILVKEGQNVTGGQKIAEMGDSDADQVELHFEIRRFGKPVDPIKYLPGQEPIENRVH